MKDREYWYTEDDIQQLLNSHFTGLDKRDRVYISAQTQFEDTALLTENISVAVAEVVGGGRVAILPINLHGNHWAVMGLLNFHFFLENFNFYNFFGFIVILGATIPCLILFWVDGKVRLEQPFF